MKSAVIVAISCALLCSCKNNEPPINLSAEEQVLTNSQTLAKGFPLLPLIEKRSWGILLQAEATAADPKATEEQRKEAEKQIEKITARLQERHPFHMDTESVNLGGISYQRESRQIKIPALVSYPIAGDARHPGELELILCSATGRAHETLFTTQTRPLHLEVLMHLAGFKKVSPTSLFRVDVIIPGQSPIPIETLIQSTGSDILPTEMLWEFSGGDFDDLYSPDQTGDFMILWHAHASVLRIRQDKIASGEIKLQPVIHPNLNQGMAVTLVLSPVEN